MTSVKVLVTGGTGFLGSALVRALRQQKHDVTILSRRPKGPGEALWHGRADNTLAARIEGTDVVVNLAGESIAGGRWTSGRKQAIVRSRVDATSALADAIAQAVRPPAVFLSGSAIGYYGVHDDTALDERSPAGSDFLAHVCVEWERAAASAAPRTRVVTLRTGLVLDKNEGVLPQMARPIWWGVGGPVGEGTQYTSWIHLHDWVGIALWAIARESVSGPLNLTAPTPVTNAELTQALARALHRPAFLRAPAFALRLVLGEMADALLLGGQRVVPHKAMSEGYGFQFPQLAGALHDIYR
jgi:uncharacterized protein (TIGR01777 family)